MIEGKKVIIRPLEIGDEEYLYRWWNDESMMEHATLAFGTLQSKERIRLSILKEIENSELYPERKRFLILRKEDMMPIGEINYNGFDSRNQKSEFGIKICEVSEQGKGYGIDALYHFIDFMFRFLNLNKIELTTMIDNKRAQSLYRKLGFKEIGIIRSGYFDSRIGEFSDVMYMDILKDEWLKIKNKASEIK
ncbi:MULTISPECIES: GNAT family N-acetyltransferase [unclassified Clostridium]|uniref:GNAT family N-acetyltransferase n=1 Tax=unclassified Clostridium TaxID=2614128 RepID=UPI0025BA22BB|nr:MULTISPECIES: GNAT family protein [unclassified Clostridium]